MICPHCNKNIEWVICVSSYFQRQSLNKDGILLPEWDDLNDSIGDTLYYLCPECDGTLVFDNHGILITGDYKNV